MKKTIAISFLFLFLCANTEIGQLLKVPNLLEHFFEHHHQQGEKKISFLDFVKSHYNDNHQRSDTEKHKNLPFKTINCNAFTVIALHNQVAILFKKPVIISVNSTFSFDKQFYTSDVFACIWLPPKLS